MMFKKHRYAWMIFFFVCSYLIMQSLWTLGNSAPKTTPVYESDRIWADFQNQKITSEEATRKLEELE